MQIIIHVWDKKDAKKAIRETGVILSQMTTECGKLININQELCQQDGTVMGNIRIDIDD